LRLPQAFRHRGKDCFHGVGRRVGGVANDMGRCSRMTRGSGRSLCMRKVHYVGLPRGRVSRKCGHTRVGHFQLATRPVAARFNGQTRSAIVWNCALKDGQDAFGNVAGPKDSFPVFGNFKHSCRCH
jgi:hypothetical protein